MKRAAVIPCLFTLGNAACGFAAIVLIATANFRGDAALGPALYQAAWLIMLAMVFDAFDGQVARMARGTTDFGAELDSLSDSVSFGVAPALLVAVSHAATGGVGIWGAGAFWHNAAYVFSLAYVCGAIMRLARFNVENSHDEAAHRHFRGLPSPAAAGAIASLIILQHFLVTPRAEKVLFFFESEHLAQVASQITIVLPPAALIVGYLMISSRIEYTHLVNKYLKGRRKIDYIGILFFVVLLATLVPEIALFAVFVGYACSGPLVYLRRVYKERREESENAEVAQ